MPRLPRAVPILLPLLLALALFAASPRAQERDPLMEAYERGMAAFEAGRFEEAVPHFERALAIAEERLGPDNPELATDLVNLGEVYRLAGRLDDAERLLRRALELDRQRAEDRPERLAVTLNNLGLLARTRGRLDEAEAYYRESLALFEKVYGPRHVNVAKVLSNLAHVELARGRPERALALLRRAEEIASASLEAGDPTRRAIAANLERVRSELAKRRAAAALEPAAGGPPGGDEARLSPAAATAAASRKARSTTGESAKERPGPGSERLARAMPAAGGSYAVHLASFKSRERAEAAGPRLVQRHRALLGGVRALPPVAVDIPQKGRFWRVMVGPYASRAAARKVCRRLRDAGSWCAVVELARASG